MSIRIFEFTVTDKSIAVTNLQRGGVQGEKNATRLDFSFEDGLKDKLIELSNDGKQLFYRFDLYDGVGGKISTDPVALDLNNETTVSHMIAEWQTHYGGTIQVYLVITLTDGEKTEMELYSYCVKMMLKSLPEAEETDGEDYESITTLAMVARESAESAAADAQTATQARNDTVKAHTALTQGSAWILDGNRGNADFDIKYVVDNEMSNTSKNPVENNVVKKYVDDEVEKAANEFTEKIDTESAKLQDKIDETFNQQSDYVLEQGVSDIWVYRKWNSGVAECWGTKTVSLNNIEKPWSNWLGANDVTLNVTDKAPASSAFPKGLFFETPILNAQILPNGHGMWLSVRGGSECKMSKSYTGDYIAVRPYTDENALISITEYKVAFHAIGIWKG